MRFLTGILLMAAAFSASATTVSCNNCTSTQMYAAAKSTPAGTTYVVNMTTGLVSKYSVYMDCEGGCTKYADLMTTETAVKNYVNFVKTYAQSQLDLASSTSFPNNGYEMVQYPQLATNVGSYIKSHGYGLVQDFLNFLSAVNPISGFNPPSMTLRVHLADGSTALFVYDHVTQTWVRVKGQTKDANGNTIPETAADASGGAGSTIVYTFYTNPNNLYDFLNRLGQLGVPISNPNNITGGGITCAGGPANCVQWK